jgi:methylmalonyl-CoA mutase
MCELRPGKWGVGGVVSYPGCMPADLALAGEFPSTDHEQWAAAVAKALDRSGELAPDEALARLRTTTYDEITIEPLYTAADAPGPDAAGFPGAAPFERGRTAAGTQPTGWDVRQRVDAAAGPGRAVEELERGATSILLDLTGVESVTADVVGAALEGVLLDLAPVVLAAGARWQAAAEAVGSHLQSGSLGADPLGETAAGAISAAALDAELDAVAGWISQLGSGRPDLRVVTVDGSRFHAAGASDAQQLGATVAAGIDYLRALDERGVSPADAIARIELRLAATADQFATIATFRAVRSLWAGVAEAVGAPDATSPIHAVTATAMMTAYDPWVNALRSTVACFAAGIAGADAVTVLPHDHVRGDAATELGRRIGRNTQSILLDESHLGEVLDPAGGSWFVERYTEQLADAGWAWVQEIEAVGGFRAAVASGLIADGIADTRAARQRDVDLRRAPLTGLSEFPNVHELIPPAVAVVAEGAGPLAPHRWSQEFEALRRRVDAVAAAGARPAVFLATIGAPAVFTPRVTFARNFFEVAGLATVTGPVSDDPAAIAAAFRTSGTTVACLCSSDPVYGEQAVNVARALLDAGAGAVYVAGRPKAALGDLAAIGVERTIHVGADVRATLAELLGLLEVP